VLTDLSFLNIGQKWPPSSEVERLKRYDNNRLLFEGDHDQVFKEWIRILRADQQAILHIILNWHKRISLLWADLLLSEPPTITSGTENSPEQEEVEKIVEDNSLVTTAHEITIDVSRFGTGIYHVYHDGTRGVIEPTQPQYWFPVVDIINVKRYIFHVLAWTYDEINAKNEKKTYLVAQIHEKGKYTTRKYLIVDGCINKEVENPVEYATRLSDFAIVPVNNTLTSDRAIGLDDYKDVDSIIQEMEIRVGQISRILDKHSDPNMYGDESAIEEDPDTGESYFKGGGKFFPVPPGGTPPGYVVWDAALEANWKEIEILMEQLYIISETSAACFGMLKQGIVESGSALKRLLISPLAKAQRIRMRMDPAVKKAIKLCSEINGGTKLEKVNIAWQDGIPTDEKEMSEVMAIRTGATGGKPTISTFTAIKRLDNKSDEDVQKELDRISDDQEAMNPMPGLNLDKNTEPNKAEDKNSDAGGDV
jgi:hypothetical protein